MKIGAADVSESAQQTLEQKNFYCNAKDCLKHFIILTVPHYLEVPAVPVSYSVCCMEMAQSWITRVFHNITEVYFWSWFKFAVKHNALWSSPETFPPRRWVQQPDLPWQHPLGHNWLLFYLYHWLFPNTCCLVPVNLSHSQSSQRWLQMGLWEGDRCLNEEIEYMAGLVSPWKAVFFFFATLSSWICLSIPIRSIGMGWKDCNSW